MAEKRRQPRASRSRSDEDDSRPITEALRQAAAGATGAEDALFALTRPDLEAIARGLYRRWVGDADITLEPSEFVSEAFIRLAKLRPVWGENRKHYFRLFALGVKQALIDHLRRRGASKRWHLRLGLDDAAGVGAAEQGFAVVELLALLERLRRANSRAGEVAELRAIVGMTFVEIGLACGTSETTAREDWEVARAWLRRELGSVSTDGSGSSAD